MGKSQPRSLMEGAFSQRFRIAAQRDVLLLYFFLKPERYLQSRHKLPLDPLRLVDNGKICYHQTTLCQRKISCMQCTSSTQTLRSKVKANFIRSLPARKASCSTLI